jgi:hypothetical protein
MSPMSTGLIQRVPSSSKRRGTNPTNAIRNFVFISFAVLVVARLCIPESVLNIFMNYTIDDRLVGAQSSSLLEKLHPATWGLFLLGGLAIRGMFTTDDQDRRIVISIVIFGSVVVSLLLYAILVGRTTALGYLVDNPLLACVTCFIMMSLSQDKRYALGHMFLMIILINSIIAIGEFAVGQRLFPYRNEEVDVVFRATGLFGHPLATGFINALSVSYVWLTKWSGPRKFATIGLLIAGCLAVGARSGAIITVVAGFGAFLTIKDRRLENKVHLKIMVLIGIVIGLPFLWNAAESFGLFGRFQNAGLFDESAQTRIRIFGVFNYIDWFEFIFGTGVDALTKYATLGLNINVENSIIVYIFQFGAIMTFLFLASVLNVYRTLAYGTEFAVKIGLIVFFMESFASNGLTTKGAGFMLAFLLALCFRRASTGRMAGAVTNGLVSTPIQRIR